MKRELKYSLAFVVSTLLISWALLFAILSSKETIELYPLVMLIPATVGLILNSIISKSFTIVVRPITTKVNIKSILFSIGFPILFIASTALLVFIFKLGDFNIYVINELVESPSIFALIIGLLLLFGEEYGWRGFLLPRLSTAKGKVYATIVVGTVWALWHAPLIYGLGCHYNLPNPLLLTIIQMGAVFVLSVPFAYSYFISNSIIPPMIFHFVWNWYNPIILGNIYQNKPGIIKGDMLLINGEGLVGLLLGFALMFWFLRKIKTLSFQ